MVFVFRFLFIVIISQFFLSCGGSKSKKSTTKPGLAQEQGNKGNEKKDVSEDLKSKLKKLTYLPNYTIIMMPEGDVQASIEKLLEGGAKLIYDPNKRVASTIPFYIAELTPEQINDDKFIKSLKLKVASFDDPDAMVVPVETNSEIDLRREFTKNIPTDSVKISQLGDPATLGKGVTVAVIDTGVDVSHPALKERVVYWYDGDETTRTELKKMTVSEDFVSLEKGGKKVKIALPKALKGHEEVYMAELDEEKFSGQPARPGEEKPLFLDLNGNNAADKFVVFVKKDESGHEIYIDVNGDQKFLTSEENRKKRDFNSLTKSRSTEGVVKFPSRNNIFEYPVLLHEEGDSFFLELGVTYGGHGTHVAGIIAAKDPVNGLMGAAPQANIMGIRVCKSSGCSSSAILKGLVETFYNGKVIPDVVNISLGSLERDSRELFSYFLNDIVAKFGAAIFISASNSGPGFKTLNHFGNSGPLIQVGANVSKKTYQDQYNLPSNGEIQGETMFFFSSLGPSYTGEMKPNIVAPGAAIAPIPAAGDYLAQMNGTSMSSPMAAGTFAAILAKVKQENFELFETIENVRKANLETEAGAGKTLMPYAYAMRDSLQSGAVALKNISLVQQGYGLIQAGKSAELLTTYLAELQRGVRDYFEVVVNDYTPTYDRSSETKRIQKFKLSVGFDGERSKESLAKILANGVQVELKQVEVLNHLGEVKTLTNEAKFKYFSLIERGNELADTSIAKISFNNIRNQEFISRRKLKNMQEGKAYIAHYQVSYKGVTQIDILDIVHRPYMLRPATLAVPSIHPEELKLEAGMSKAGVEIKTSHYHRYPIMVTKDMVAIEAIVSIDVKDQGILYVNLNRPDGSESGVMVAARSDIFPDQNQMAKIVVHIPEGKLSNEKPFEGIWELTVAAGSSNGPKKTKYDVMARAHKFGTKKLQYTAEAGKVKLIPVQNKQYATKKVGIANVYQLKPIELQIKSSYTSFHPLPLPKDYKGLVNIAEKPIKDDKVESTETVAGAIDQALYTLNENGEFTPYKKAKEVEEAEATWEIEKAANTTLYMAYYTDLNFVESKEEMSVVKKINLLVKTPLADPEVLKKIKLEFENFPETQTGVVRLDLTKSPELKNIEINSIIFADHPEAALEMPLRILVFE